MPQARNALLALLVVAPLVRAADLPPANDPSLKRFTDRFLKLLKDPQERTFRSAAATSRIADDAKAFLQRHRSGSVVDPTRLRAEWLDLIATMTNDSWDSCQVVKTMSRGDKVVRARLRLRAIDGGQADCVVWLIEDDGERKLIDLQRLPTGMRVAAIASLGLMGDAPEVVADELLLAEQGMLNDPRRTFWEKKEFNGDYLQAFRDRACLGWAANAHRPKEALRRAAALGRDFKDDPAVAWLSAKAHFELDQHTEAARALELYESQVGADAWSRLLRAKSLRQQGRFADARRECAEAIKDDPSSSETAIELFEVAPPHTKAAAAALLPTGSTLETLAWTLGAELGSAKDTEALEAILKHAEKNNAPVNTVAYLRGELLLAQGKPKEAAAAVADHLPRIDDEDDDADNLIDLHCEAMHQSGRALDAYRRSVTPRKAFLALVDKFDEAKDANLIDQLAGEHLARHGDDVEAVEQYATVLYHRNKFSEAARVLDAYLDRADAEDVDSIDDLRVRIFLAHGNVEAALRFIEDDDDLFNVAAADLADAGRVDDLAKLIDGFAPKVTDAALFANWKGELAFLKKDYKLAGMIFTALVDPTPEAPKGELDDRRRTLFLRTLLHVRLTTGLEKAAERFLPPNAELGLALAYAATENAAKLEIALENCLEAGVAEKQLLDDPDLGPLLAGPKLIKIRDKVLLDRDLNP